MAKLVECIPNFSVSRERDALRDGSEGEMVQME